ncbi:Fascin domain [Phytophthora infestans]|uniref:Fascin domain n=1 Tax=Phytophthora infestans TaxID=4787 RepID=A0A833SXG7_PHYIN|nr:Fascin domain [Phytophthora infestans]
MDLTDIPFNVPVILWSFFRQKTLQSPFGTKKAHCLTDNRDFYEQMILRRVRDDKVAIQSVHNGRYLQVRSSGECVFDSKEPGEREFFTMETHSNYFCCALYFVSCNTGLVLQCDENDVVKCANQLREVCEAWRIVEPRTSTAPTTTVLQRAGSQRYVLAEEDRQRVVEELAGRGKTPEEIEQIVMIVVDAPVATASTSPLVVPVYKA